MIRPDPRVDADAAVTEDASTQPLNQCSNSETWLLFAICIKNYSYYVEAIGRINAKR